MAELLDDSEAAPSPAAARGCPGEASPPPPEIDPRAFDVGPDCPQDSLLQRLNEARARLLLNPPKLGPSLRWRI